MAEQATLLEAYRQAPYQVVGHGPRNLQILKQALEGIDGDTLSDMYGQGDVIQRFEQRLAHYLGKEAAVFFPSGTMAQQIALRVWCDDKGMKKVAYHPLCHLEIHEQDGLKELHHIEPVLLANKQRLIDVADVTNMTEDIACLLLELPQREIGGQLPDFATLQSISAYCRANGIKLHLDGARLFEVLPYYNKTAAEICDLFDSVYVSFYKGIGGIAGAILAGDKAFTEQTVPWKRRHGGDLISLYPYIVSAEYYFDERIDKMAWYYEEARELAALFNRCPSVSTLPEIPVSNMFHVHVSLPKAQVEEVLIEVYQETNVALTSNLREVNDAQCYFEVSIGDVYETIPKETLEHAFTVLAQRLVVR